MTGKSEDAKFKPAVRWTRSRERTGRSMVGLHEGDDLRAELVDGAWRAEAKLRDVGSLLDPPVDTGLYEYAAGGDWVPIGSFRTLHLAEVAKDFLKDGSHLVRRAYSESCGSTVLKVPAGVIPYASARERMVELGLVDDFTPAGGSAGPAP